MKKTSLFLLLAVCFAAMLTSCSKSQPADARSLLKGVPSDASFVAVANARSLLEKAGCKVDGQKVEPSAEVSRLLESADDDMRQLVSEFFSGDAGVDPSVLVLFAEGYYRYLTGVAADPAKFKAMVEKKYGAAFAETDGVSVCREVALVGNVFWIKSKGEFDPNEAKHFSTLDESQSFLSCNCADQLSEIDEDIVGWANIGGMLNTSGIGFQDRAIVQVALQSVFEDASDAMFSIDFEKGKAEAEIKVLNPKGKMAKCVLPTQKLDVAALDKIGGEADVLAALAVPRKLVEQLKKSLDQRPSLFGAYLSLLTTVDGTCAVAMGENGKVMSGVISTDGKDSSALTAAMSQSGLTARLDGNDILFSRGTLSGRAPVQTLAPYLKGAVGGVVAPDSEGAFFNTGNGGVSLLAVTLNPDGGSLEVKIVAETADPKENSLLTLLRCKK